MSRMLLESDVRAGVQIRPPLGGVPWEWGEPTRQRELSQAPRRAIALVLAGGRGSRLMELTNHGAKPAVFFGGKFRIIDFALSNCINSGFRRVSVLTQYKSHSLLRHLQSGWSFLRAEVNEFIDLMPAQQQIDEDVSWYKGTADAVRQNLDVLRGHRPEYVLILAGDHICKMDYAVMLGEHIALGADVTVSCIEIPRAQASRFGIVEVDSQDRIKNFVEKPNDPQGLPSAPDRSLVSMGIYIFNAGVLFEELTRDARDDNSSHDFGKDVIPNIVSCRRVIAHRFERSCVYSHRDAEPYWRDVGALDTYWEANIDLTRLTPALNLYDPDWPIFTHQEQLPPAKFVHDIDGRRGMAVNSLVSCGCIVSGARVQQSLLFWKVRVNSYSQLDQAVILPECNIGRGARLTKVVVDRGCHVPDGLVAGEDADADIRRFHRSPGGVTLITAPMLAALG
jgi:glucose-1-phosphate adenylyltransferase